MTDDQLDRLTKIVTLIESCAKMGGTAQFKDIQRLTNKALDEITRELLDEEREALANQSSPPANPPAAYPGASRTTPGVQTRPSAPSSQQPSNPSRPYSGETIERRT